MQNRFPRLKNGDKMISFDYVIKDEIGLHARPAGMLVKEARKYKSRIVIKCGEKSAEAIKLMALMSICIKCGNTITVEVNGEDESLCAENLKEFFKTNL